MYLWYMYIAILDFLFVLTRCQIFRENIQMYLFKCSDVNLLFMIWKELNFSYLITRKAMSLVPITGLYRVGDQRTPASP